MNMQNKAKILIVEDNPINMKLVTEILKSAGYGVLEAYDADSGIALARDETPALILMDIQLPGRDGLDATRILKQDARTKKIKIIALTSFAMKGDREKFLEAGCDGYIPKPVRYKELLEIVKEFMNK
jgi:two-component system cell cycle response regulator DivK